MPISTQQKISVFGLLSISLWSRKLKWHQPLEEYRDKPLAFASGLLTLHGYRRLGIGKQVAHEIWQRFPGIWEVRVIARNQKAKIFWERAIAEFTGKAIEPVSFDKAGESWHLFSFESKCAA